MGIMPFRFTGKTKAAFVKVRMKGGFYYIS